MIIIEGPDGTGKTTLAKKLRVALGLSSNAILHSGPPTKTGPHNVSGAWVDYTGVVFSSETPVNAVMDRFIYGERVYGPLLRNDRRFTIVHQRMIERLLFSTRSVVVFCLPPYEQARDNWKARREAKGELITDERVYEQTYQEFERIRREVQLPCIVWDPFLWPVEDLVKAIRNAKPPINVGPGHGMFSSDSTLLVGDFLSHDGQPMSWPAIEYASYSPMYKLTVQLELARIREDQLYWVNSHKLAPRGKVLNRMIDFLEIMKPRKIISVGEGGNAWIRENRITAQAFVPGVIEWFNQHPFADHPLIQQVLRR